MIQYKYHQAFRANHYPNNIMSVGGVDLFVDQAIDRNFYVYPVSAIANQEPFIDENGRITVANEVKGYEYSNSSTTASNWLHVIENILAYDINGTTYNKDQITFMVAVLAAEPHRYPPNHITHLIALKRVKNGDFVGTQNANQVMHFEGTKDPVAVGEVEDKLRDDRAKTAGEIASLYIFGVIPVHTMLCIDFPEETKPHFATGIYTLAEFTACNPTVIGAVAPTTATKRPPFTRPVLIHTGINGCTCSVFIRITVPLIITELLYIA